MRGEFVDVRGVRLYYYAAGTRGAGEPIVLVHGFPGSSHLWHRVVPLLPAGHRAVVLDLLGAGRSDPANSPADLTAVAHVERLHAFFDELGIAAACVVGHGAGGAVAQALALTAPARVSRLVLVSSVAFDGRPAFRLATWLSGAPGTGALGAAPLAFLVRAAALDGYRGRTDGRRSLHLYLRPFTGRGRVASLAAQLRALNDSSVPACAARLGELRCPTAIVWGARDPILPVALAERLRAAIQGASLHVIADGRHYVPEEEPEEVARAVRAVLARKSDGRE